MKIMGLKRIKVVKAVLPQELVLDAGRCNCTGDGCNADSCSSDGTGGCGQDC